MKASCVRQSAWRAGVTLAPRWGGGAVGGEMPPMRQRALPRAPGASPDGQSETNVREDPRH
jgi:hypothetical protein